MWYFVVYVRHPSPHLQSSDTFDTCDVDAFSGIKTSDCMHLSFLNSEGGYVFTVSVCLFVCLSVCYITEKVVSEFLWYFSGWGMAQGVDEILVAIPIKIQIRDFFKRIYISK